MERSIVFESYEEYLDFEEFIDFDDSVIEMIFEFENKREFCLKNYWGKRFRFLRIIVFPDNLDNIPIG
jgi:hypothetical protein